MDADSPGYFAAASEYIHLNPARAGLLDAKKPELLDYRWSSYPMFVGRARLPDWLRRERVFSGLDLKGGLSASRRRYRGWMTARTHEVLEQKTTSGQTEQWRKLRRGWYLGGDSFRDRLMDWAEGLASGRKRSSYDRRESLRAHDGREAARLLAEGLKRLEITLHEAALLKKADPRKQALAWLVKSRTVVDDEWISRHLTMGHRSNVSRAVSAFRAPKQFKHRQLKKLLHICTD